MLVSDKKVKVATKPPRLPNPICHPVPTERRKCPATKEVKFNFRCSRSKSNSPTIAVEPADDDGHGGVDSANGQEEGTVFNVVVVLDSKEGGESSEGDEEGEKDKEETVF